MSDIKGQNGGIYTYKCAKFKRGIGYGFRYVDPSKGSRKKQGFERKADAERERTRILAEINAGHYIAPERGKTTVGEIGSVWLEDKRVTLKKGSYDKYESLWRVHVAPRWGTTQVANITHGAVQKWVSELHDSGLGGKQIGAAYDVLRMVLKTAVKDKRIAENPCEDIELPDSKPLKPRRYLTMPELFTLAKAASKRKSGDFSTLILFMGTTGLRFGEATALRVKNIDFDNGRIRVCENAVWSGKGMHVNSAKNGDDRTVVYPKRLLGDRLRKACQFKDPDALVFERPNAINNGQHLTESDYLRPPNKTGWFEAAVKQSGLPRLTLHDLRHTAVSLAVHAQVPLKVVQRIAGHKTATMTLDVYADLFTDDLTAYGERMDAEADAAIKALASYQQEHSADDKSPFEVPNGYNRKKKKPETIEISGFSWFTPTVPPERVELSLSD